MKIRRYEERDLEPLSRMITFAFGGSVEENREYYEQEKNPRFDPEQIHIIEEDGEARASATVLPLEVFVDGKAVPMGGVSAVFAHPAYRRRGYAGKLMRTLLADLRQRGVHLSMLWPFSHPFYRAHGYELASESITYDLKPTDLPTSPEQRRVRAARETDLPRMMELHEETAKTYPLCVRRSETHWTRTPEKNRPPVAVYERDGDLEGYVMYRMSDHDQHRSPHRRLSVVELVASTRGAWEGLHSFMAAQDPLVFGVRLATSRNEPLHPYLESSYVKAEVEPEFMLRLVDVEGALGYLERATKAPLVLEVSDDVTPENNGEFTIGEGKIFRGAGAKHRVKLDVRRLAQLYAGYLPARRLAEHGLVEPDSSEALELLEEFFSQGNPWVFSVDHF